MKKIKFKKSLLLGFLGIAVVAGTITAVATSCGNDKDKEKTPDNSGSGGTQNNQQKQSKYVLETFYKATPDSNTSSYVATMNSLIDDGARFILASGYTFDQPLAKSLGEGEGLKHGTVVGLIDQKYNGKANADRIASVEFRTDHGGFAAGIAAAYYLNANQSVFTNEKKQTLKWGGFVGQGYASTLSFIKGFQEGVNYANEKLMNKDIVQENDAKTTKKWIKVEQASAGSSYASGAWGPGEGTVKQIVSQLISNNADIILPVAGGQTVDVTDAAATNTVRPILAIGVDVDQEKNVTLNKESQTFKNVNGGKTILFSIKKEVALAAEGLVTNALEPKPLTGDAAQNALRLGTHSLVGFEKESHFKGKALVGISEPGKKYLIDALKTAGIANVTDYDSAINALVDSDQFALLTVSNTYVGANGVSTEYAFNETSFLDANQTTRKSSENFKNQWNATTNNDEKAKLVKVALGDAGSRIDDQSFNQSTYEGLKSFYETKDIIIPSPTGKK
ncbi:BMP family ABC transporter substrate-binding protein [Ureaplasma zalophigenitalium]|uniref:BMP family ABC transporter substrate-binding protein n=1 Tax=Ureaplasma zalophigenitalium TaxID=907723 RepID=A0ABT3BNM3_9BACT|nr:BMP family ABC transporter substrate-binding protein [Ureaplasma zalophigenitalium]MCV3753834.1 BMP family ABC transporter substrate-binding protein [Ureaplasma zalophigenitalium]